MPEELTFLLHAPVIERVQIKETALRAMIGRGDFPKPFKLDGKRNAWMTADVDNWLASRAAQRQPARQ